MLPTRAEWGKYVMERHAELAEVFKEAHQLFGARVIKMQHEDPDACWGDEFGWSADGAITPYFRPESNQNDNKTTVKKYPAKRRRK